MSTKTSPAVGLDVGTSRIVVAHRAEDDIRYDSQAELRAGQNFQIIELNGAASEATSIYDARNSLRKAYRTLFRQWELVFAIGAANQRSGAAPTKLSLLWRKWRETTAMVATYPLAD